MSGIGILVPAFAAGAGLGAVFFGGLWWTVTRTATATVPAAWFGVSAVLRMAIMVLGLYGCARSGLPALSACLCGVLVARAAVQRLIRIPR